MEQVEARIRDQLVQSLAVLEIGLEYVEKEAYLPNDIGTRGFVDILAKDRNGRWVLIELKRSNAASREALHEVLKYIEAFKKNRSVREHEIRIMVVSTEWRELLVPFSSFVARTECSVEGFLLEVDSSHRPIRATRVETLPVNRGRVFAPWHELALYENQESARRGKDSYEKACSAKGISDFVLIEMTPHPSHRDKELDAMVAAYESMGMSEHADRERISRQLPIYQNLLYFAPLMQTEEFCRAVVGEQAEPEDLEEFLGYIHDMESEERLCSLHEKIYEVGPKIHRDYFEIAYPAKFGSKLLDSEGWTITAIHRYGGLAANELLSDESIVSELRGNDGATGQKYSRKLSVKNRAELAAARGDIGERFKDNLQLSQQMLFCIDNAISAPNIEFLEVHLYNPSHITLSIYMEVAGDGGGTYVPAAWIAAFSKDGSLLRYYQAVLEPNGRSPSFTHLLDSFYGGRPEGLISNLSWGGYDQNDAEVCEAIGLSYSVYRFEGDPRFGQRLENFRWVDCDFPHPLSGFYGFVNTNEDFVDDIIQLYSKTWNGFMVMWDRDTKFSFKT